MHTINLGGFFALFFSWTVDTNMLKLELNSLNFTLCLHTYEGMRLVMDCFGLLF